jgi:outer membrane protein assembly factor BamB
VALRSGHITARDMSDGRERWHRDLPAAHPLAVDAGFVFAATDKTVNALHAEDGTVAWSAPASVTAPLVARAGWVIVLAEGKVIAFRGSDGSRIWEREVGAATERPAIEADHLYVSLPDGRVVAFQIRNGELLWERQLGAAAQVPFATAERVYVGSGDRKFYCLKADNGEIEWTWRFFGAAPQGSAAANSSLLFVMAMDNVLRAYARSNGNQRWQHPLRRRAGSGPIVLGDYVLVPSAFSAEIWAWTSNGKPAGTIATPAEPAVVPEFVDRGGDGVFIFVVTGGLTNQWQLTLLSTAGDPPFSPLTVVPGQTVSLTR